MSGHSQFANIKHRKDAQDAKRAKIFIKIAKEINVAVKKGGSNPDTNSALRLALDKARSNNMPKDNYEKAIKKAAGQTDTSNYEEIRYEGYGPLGVAIIVDCLTDNRNRTAANIRSYFHKKGGSLGQTNSVSYLFNREGHIYFTTTLSEEEILNLIVDELYIVNFIQEGKQVLVITNPDKLMQVKNNLMNKNIIDFDMVENVLVANQKITLNDEHKIKQLQDLVGILEDDDDVQQVYHNGEF